jgi:phytoene/squalene synthetase
MTTTLAASITHNASKQSYYTVRFLVDRERVEDAFRAYAYFRWVDDVLDADSPSGPKLSENEVSERRDFLKRQKTLLDGCLQGERMQGINPQEELLVELVRQQTDPNSGLHAYLLNMMKVMDFDTRRRGRLISQADLNSYTRWLAMAVTEALHYFIGHDSYAPQDETRYQAVSAAHIVHMLRDTYDDVQAGYFNIPSEVLEANAIEPQDVDSEAYRLWVKSRVGLARQNFAAGRSYFYRVQNLRHRLAGFAYIARFEWLLETIEKEGFLLRAQYNERKSLHNGLRMGWQTLYSMISLQGKATVSQPVVSQRHGKV